MRKVQGVVIVIALFIMILIAGIAYVMMSTLARDVYRTRLIVSDSEMRYLAKGSLSAAIIQLKENIEKQETNKRLERMPIKTPRMRVHGFTIESTINDCQAKFNLNNLIDDKIAKENMDRLISLVYPAFSAKNREDFINALLDWLTPEKENNTFDEYYANLNPRYRPAHRPMVSLGELQLIKGMTAAFYQALKPFVTALPMPTKLNINTADALNLAVLSKSMTVTDAKQIVNLRAKEPFLNLENFLALPKIKSANYPRDKITLLSDYFLVTTSVRHAESERVIYTLLERKIEAESKQVKVLIVWQNSNDSLI